MHRRQPVAAGEVGTHLLGEQVVLEQLVELDEHRIGLVGQLRHPHKDIFRRIAIDEHDHASLPLTGSTPFYRRPRRRLSMISGRNALISHR